MLCDSNILICAMQDSAGTPNSATYCRKCGYDLRASANRCPECGTAFDATNPRTFRPRPRRRLPWWVRLSGVMVVLLACAVAGAWGWLYYGWRVEEDALAEVQARTRVVGIGRRPIGPAWLAAVMGTKHAHALDRMETLLLMGPADDRAVALIPRFSHLESLVLDDVDLGARDWERICEMPGMTRLQLNGGRIAENDWSRLGALVDLQHLDLYEMTLTPTAIDQLGRLPHLKSLAIGGRPIPLSGLGCSRSLRVLRLDGGAANPGSLAGLPRLRGLQLLVLRGDAVTDEAMDIVRQMPDLEALYLEDVAVGPKGVAALKGAPKLRTVRYHLLYRRVDRAELEQAYRGINIAYINPNQNNNPSLDELLRLYGAQ